MGIEQARNYRKVSDRLATSGVVGADLLQSLGAEGFEVVVNLLPADSVYAVAGEEGIVKRQNIVYHSIPVDFAHPTPADFERFAEVMDAVRDKKVLVHCAANYRVSAFYSLYARSRGAWSEAQAREFVRSVWNPADYPGWPEFFRQVEATLDRS